MKTTEMRATVRMNRSGVYCILVAMLFSIMAASGCTVNRMSLLIREPAAAPVKASDVKTYPSFKELRAPWRLEGMISAYTLPIASNSAAKREALIRETVAGLGVDALVGLQQHVGENLKRTSRSVAILARTGAGVQARTDAVPKFIVCVPHANVKIDKTQATDELDQYLLEHAQFSFSYMKGYYVYRCEASGVNEGSLLQGSVDPQNLSEPIGITPDYVLLNEIEGYDEKGNIVVHRSYTLKLALALYDMKEKKKVWSSSTSGISSRSIIAAILTFGGTETGVSDELQTVRSALDRAMDSLPAVAGFRRGDVSPLDRK